MKDQGSVNGSETPAIKYDRALALFTESVMKPDHDLRGCAHNQGCYNELLEIREHVLKYLKTLKEVTYHYNPDESDEIEILSGLLGNQTLGTPIAMLVTKRTKIVHITTCILLLMFVIRPIASEFMTASMFMQIY